jgi:MFS family permease
VQVFMVAGLSGMFFLGALYLQRVLGYDPLEVGLAFLPVALTIGALSLGLSARLIVRYGARATLLPGLALIVAGLVVMQRAPVGASYLVEILPAMLMLGVGGGLSFPSVMTLAMAGADPREAGLTAGLVNTTQQVGGAFGLAVLATLSSGRTTSLLQAGVPEPWALTEGYHLAFALGALSVVAAIALTVGLLRPSDGLAAAEPALEPAYWEEAA